MKICCDCKTEKEDENFAIKVKKTGQRNYRCKDCQRVYSRKHYHKNRQEYLDRLAKRRQINRDKLMNYLSNKRCIDCQEKDPIVLQFDHVRGKKILPVSTMITRCFAWAKILKEIKKCEIRCANCHVRKTAKQFGWWKSKDCTNTFDS